MVGAGRHEVEVGGIAAIHHVDPAVAGEDVHEAGAREGVDPGVSADAEAIGSGGGVDAQGRDAGEHRGSCNAGANRHRLQPDVTSEHRENLAGGR